MENWVLTFIFSHPYHVGSMLAFTALLYLLRAPPGIYTSFPLAKSSVSWGKAVHVLVQEGYSRINVYSQKPFVVNWWSKDYIILPPKYLTDLKTAGWKNMSFLQNINDALFLSATAGDLYTGPASERMVEVVKKYINPNLPKMTPVILEEVNYAFVAQLQSSTDWNEVPALEFFSIVAHRVATRVFVGDDLCRNLHFLQISQAFLNSIFTTALVIVKLPLGPFRNLLSFPLSQIHAWRLRRCHRILLPIVKKRIEEIKSIKGGSQDSDAIDWTLHLATEKLPCNTPQMITRELLYSLWAASSAPGGMITEIIYQLLSTPEYLEPLRLEARSAVENHGWSEKMLSNLPMQDSFIREVNRLYPTGSITCTRTVVGQPFRFSDGLTLPIGTRIGFPIKAILSDAANFTNPLEFDGFRFVKQISNESGVSETKKRWGATSMGTTNLAWGYGNHICPGRFFAVREMKIVISKVLVEFDIKWARKETERPHPVHVEGQFIPNMEQKIWLKKR